MLQPLVDHDPVRGRVDLGHPGLARVEQVDGLGHHLQRIGVGRGELAGPLPQRFDLVGEVCHGGDVTARFRHCRSRRAGPCPVGPAGPVGRVRPGVGPGLSRRRQPLGHQLEPVHGLHDGHPHVAGAPVAVELAGADQEAGVVGQPIAQRPTVGERGRGRAPTGRSRPPAGRPGRPASASASARNPSRSRYRARWASTWTSSSRATTAPAWTGPGHHQPGVTADVEEVGHQVLVPGVEARPARRPGWSASTASGRRRTPVGTRLRGCCGARPCQVNSA